MLDIDFEKSFDIIFTSGVIEHIKPELLPHTFQKMYDLSNRYILNHEAMMILNMKSIGIEVIINFGQFIWKKDGKIFL